MTAAAARVRIGVDGLGKTYGLRGREVHAVDRVTFDIFEGEFVALIGPSGCGKSTILNMVAGLLPASSGAVTIDGARVTAGRPNRRVGYVFQRDTVFPWRTVSQNIGYGLELARVPRADRERRVARMIEGAGLTGFGDAFPLALSGGMRQRVALMRTLITQPEILLMDEPFGALDTHTKLEMHQDPPRDLGARAADGPLRHPRPRRGTDALRPHHRAVRPAGPSQGDLRGHAAAPRDAVLLRESPEFAAAFSRIWHSLGEEFQKGHME